MTKRIFLDLQVQMLAGDKRRPSEVVRDLGFTYSTARGDSLGDCFVFDDCQNIPAVLPDWIRVQDLSPTTPRPKVAAFPDDFNYTIRRD